MKKPTFLISIIIFIVTSSTLLAQESNMVMNGSFENTSGKVCGYGQICLADSISSSNYTTVDLYSKDARNKDFAVPANYSGTQETKTGNNYAGFTAYYADDAGIFKTEPGYRKYSEYIQFNCSQPLVSGKSYAVSFNVSLAEASAYAVSGLGFYFSVNKTTIKNYSFLQITPNAITTDIITSKEWTTVSGIYVASGGERYLTIGCFDDYMETEKIILPFTNNNRKAYYYIDDVSMAPKTISKDDITSILSGSCYQLNNLNFETDKATILSNSFEELNSLSKFLKNYPYVFVYIDGYTDKTGTEKHNDKLSEERATSVKNYLVKNGINTKRLKARGNGEKQPIDTKNDISAVNRRVEITICAFKN